MADICCSRPAAGSEICEQSSPTVPTRVELPVVGLRRSSITSLEQVITTIPGVSRAVVNVSENRSFVDFDPVRSKVANLLEVVRGAGFSPGVQTLRLKVSGLYCAECVTRIEDAFKQVPSVFDATMNAVTEEAKVTYAATIGDLSRLTQSVETAGPYRARRAAEASESEMDKEAETMEREYRSLMRKWWFAAAVGVPTMILSYPWIFPILRDWFPRGSENLRYIWYAMGVASLAGLIYSGRQFFEGMWQGLKHRSANIHTFIALGTGVAWLYSTIALVFPPLWLCLG